jgi:hypothetical protein
MIYGNDVFGIKQNLDAWTQTKTFGRAWIAVQDAHEAVPNFLVYDHPQAIDAVIDYPASVLCSDLEE